MKKCPKCGAGMFGSMCPKCSKAGSEKPMPKALPKKPKMPKKAGRRQ